MKECTFPFLLTKPISRVNLFIIKYISGLAMVILIFLIGYLISLATRYVILPTLLPNFIIDSLNIPNLPQVKKLLLFLFCLIFYYSISLFSSVWLSTRLVLWIVGIVVVLSFTQFIYVLYPNPKDYIRYIILTAIIILIFISSINIFKQKEIK
jgi:ABC-type transport system involved in multi-copper enzyme maturation permease subunit